VRKEGKNGHRKIYPSAYYIYRREKRKVKLNSFLFTVILVALILSGCASSQIKALQKDYQEFARKAGLKDRELEEKITMLEANRENDREEFEKNLKKISSEVSKLSKKLSRMETEFKDSSSVLQNLDDLKEKLENTSRKTANLGQKVETLEKKTARLEELNKQQKENQQTFDTLQERLSKVEADLEDFASEVGNLNASLMKIQEEKPLASTWRVLMETIEFAEDGRIERDEKLARNRSFLLQN
jgi:chromosome segregation ATPase